MKVFEQLLKALNKFNPHSCTMNNKGYQSFRNNLKSFILAWSRYFTCEICGKTDLKRTLHFHHTNPSNKEVAVGDNLSTFSKKITESLKCDYLCDDCHYDIHVQQGDFSEYYDAIHRWGYHTLQSMLGCTEGS